MFASTLFTATPYCSIHRKFFLESLQAWCSLSSTHYLALWQSRADRSPRDECMMLARRTFKAQFPSLYTSRTLKDLGKDVGYAPPRLAHSYTVGRVS
jgi:hypothetical protein